MIATWAAAYVGIPFRSGGRDRSGCDCWGLLSLAYREVYGIQLPSFDDEYDRAGDRAVIEGLVAQHLPEMPWQPVAAVIPGDALLFNVAGQSVHVGVAVGDGRFLHVLSTLAASCVERLAAPGWHRRLVGAYRYGA